MKKISCVVSCPISTYSGYGGRSRDFVRALVESYPDWDIKILSQRWGKTRMSYLEDSNDTFFRPLIIPNLTYNPDVWIQITVPNEFRKLGQLSIGVTAGIETTACHHSWIEGLNNMDLVLVSSEHAKSSLTGVQYEVKDQKTNQVKGHLQATKPVEVLFEGIDTSIYKVIDDSNNQLDLSSIEENFCFLTIGHWMQGDLGQDRKNIGYTIKAFLETFKNKDSQPALILKTLQATSSIMDKYQVMDKIDAIRRTVKGKLPNIYLLHGDMSDKEINELYNHPKVKCLISLTKGEGYGRPLAEFASIGKPIIASNWSGHTDFLKTDLSLMIGGTLENVHPSAAVKDMILLESKWFKPNDMEVGEVLRKVFKEYKSFTGKSKEQANYILSDFTYDKMKQRLVKILNPHVDKIPRQVELQLPKINLPKLKKIE